MKSILSFCCVASVFAFSPQLEAGGIEDGGEVNGPGVKAFAACTEMFPAGVIPDPQSQTVLDLCKQADGEMGGRALFAIRYDTIRKTPIWTTHLLTPDLMRQITANSGTMKRPKFKPDTQIAADDQAVDKSYVRSGYARGHIVPANDMSWAKAAYDTTFHFSNVVPQKQTFNAGTWLGEEDAFRKYVKAKNTLMWVFSGVYGTVEDDPTTPAIEGPTIGSAPYTPTVPKCFYKIVVARPDANGPYKVLATVYDWNDFGKRATWVKSITKLQTIETRTGIDFLKGLTVQSAFDDDYWAVELPDTPSDCQ